MIKQRKLQPSKIPAINCQGDTVELSLTEDDVEQLTHPLERGASKGVLPKDESHLLSGVFGRTPKTNRQFLTEIRQQHINRET
jgi:hypothetical protein